MALSFAFATVMSVGFVFFVHNDSNLQAAQRERLWTDDGYFDTTWFTNYSDTFTISTPQQLAGLAHMANVAPRVNFSGMNIRLGGNIDLTGRTWFAINDFRGNLDGNGYTITLPNVVRNAHGSEHHSIGLFAMVRGGSVRDLTVAGHVTVQGTFRSTLHVGGLSGLVQQSSIENVTNRAGITATAITAQTRVFIGGVIGRAIMHNTLTDLANHGAISARTGAEATSVGGIIGQLSFSVHGGASGLHNEGRVSVTAASTAAHATAGVIGSVHSQAFSQVALTNMMNIGQITGPGAVQFVGRVEGNAVVG